VIDAAFIRSALRLPEQASLGPPPCRVRRDVVRGVGLWAMDAAREAVEGVTLSDRLGLYVGMGGLRPGWDELMPRLAAQDGGPPWERGLRGFHPFWMLRNLSNNVHALLAAELGATADGATYSGEASGGVALHAAIEALHLGVIDQALVVAYDQLLQPEIRVEREGPLAEAAAAVLLARDGPIRVSPWQGPSASESRYGAPQLLIDLIRLAGGGGTAMQCARPGERVGIRVTR